MRPTFTGFYTARSGIQAARTALDVTGNNMANLNTEGYTVQRLDTTSLGGQDVGMRYANPGGMNIGQGVFLNQVNQSRDPYLDRRYRLEIARVGEQAVTATAKQDIDDMFNEIVNENGLQSKINELISSLQDVNEHRGEQDFETIVKGKAESIASLFRNWSKKLGEIREQQQTYFEDEGVDAVNSLMRDIATLNKEIREADVAGAHALELQDQRNSKIDELAQYIDIDVKYQKVQVGAGRTVDELHIDFVGATGERFELIDHDQFGKFTLRTDSSGRPLEEPLLLDLTTANGKQDHNSTDGSTTFDNAQIGGGQFKSYLDLLNDSGEYDVVNKTDLYNTLTGAGGKISMVNDLLQKIGATNGSSDAEDVKQRTLAVQELKNYLDIDVEQDAADVNKLTIRMKTENEKIDIVTPTAHATFSVTPVGAPTNNPTTGTVDPVYSINVTMPGGTKNVSALSMNAGGLKFDMVRLNAKRATENGNPTRKTPTTTHGIGYYQKRLDTLASTFADTLNKINSTNEKTGAEDYNKPFFSNGPGSNSTYSITAANINVAQLWTETQGSYITSSKNGNNENINYMKKMLSSEMDFKTPDGEALFTGTLQTYATNMSTLVGKEQKDAADFQTTFASNLGTIDRQRQSVSSVSIDEETANLMMYGQSLNASSRVMTTLDEALDVLINKMGLVGR